MNQFPSSTCTRACALLSAALLAGGALQAQSAQEILARVREATQAGAAELPATGLLLQGEADYMGAGGRFELLVGSRGRFHFQVFSPLPMQTGFDGETCWEVDWMSTPRILELRDREEAIATAALRTGSWLAAEDGGVFSVEDGPASAEDECVLLLRLRGGRYQGRLRVARKTWLPLSFRADPAEESDELFFQDWRPAGGFFLPHRLVSRRPGGLEDTLVLSEIQDAPHYLRDPFAFHPAPPDNGAFAEGVGSRLEAKLAPTGHLLVQATLDGGEPRWCIFDTGAGALCVSTPVAAELGMEAVGSVSAQGVGGRQEARLLRGRSIQVGPLAVESPVFVELDLSFLEPHLGEPIAAIVGYGVLARSVVELDMQAGVVALYPPDGYALGRGRWQELILSSRHPAVRARFEGDREGIFKLDTGAAGSTAMFHAPAVRELGLLEGRETTAVASGGVGGFVEARIGTLEWFELAGHRFEEPRVGFAVEDKGAFGDRWTTGNLGGGFLSPFRLVLDYPHRRIAFVPRVESD